MPLACSLSLLVALLLVETDHIQLARQFKRQGRSTEAEKAYRTAITAAKGEKGTDADRLQHIRRYRAIALVELGSLLRQPGRQQEAAASFFEAVAVDPTNSRAMYNCGTVVQQNDPRKAYEYFVKAVTNDPMNAYAHFGLATMQGAGSDSKGALASYKQAIVLRPDFHQALNNIGLMQGAAGQHKAATKSFKRALKANPTFGEAMNNLASTYQNRAEHAPESHAKFMAKALEMLQR